MITFILHFPSFPGAKDMWRAYSDMREANYKGADKYFHARGNYDAAQRGPGGAWAAEVIRYQGLLGCRDEGAELDSPGEAVVVQGQRGSSGDCGPSSSCPFCSSVSIVGSEW